MKRMRITVNGTSYDVTVELLGPDGTPRPSVAPAPMPASVAAPAPVRAAPAPAALRTAPAPSPAAPVAQGAPTIKAPMAGVILRLFVSPLD